MSINNPRITVLMPAYNAEKYIYEAIDSVLKQSFQNFELLIINDGSTDDTLKVIQSFNDPRVIYYTQENKGVAAALNKGLTLARAPYIARFDADDICYPNRLQVQYDFIVANPEYSIIGSGADYVDIDGTFIFTNHPVAHSNYELQTLDYKICAFIHSSILYKKDIIISSGGYNELAYTFEDHLLWARIIANEKVCNLPQSLIKVRLNPESVTIDEKWTPAKFQLVKNDILKNKNITPAQSVILHEIGRRQISARIKNGAYYALCGKKFLVNNYQPQKARKHIAKAISIHPLRLDNYLLYIISYFPESIIHRLHNGAYNPIKQLKLRS